MPARIRVDLIITEGASFSQDFIWTTGPFDENVDISNHKARLVARPKMDSDTVIFDLDTDNGGIVIADQEADNGAHKGMYSIVLSKEDTTGICPNHVQRDAVYDLYLEDENGNTVLHQYGKMVLIPTAVRNDTDSN